MKFARKFLAISTIALLAAVQAFALPPTALTVQVLKQNSYAVQAGDLVLTMTACDNSNGNTFVATGQEVLIVQNTDTSPHTFTISSVADALGRTDTSLTAYSVAGPAFAVIQLNHTTGWLQSGSKINLACSSNLVSFAVVRYQ